MPGRNDYGSLANQALADPRFRALGLALRKDKRLLEALAFVAGRGVIVHLGLWALRETDDGVLPGDGVDAVKLATGLDESHAERLARLLASSEIKLIRPAKGGKYLAGFKGLYGRVVKARKKNRDRVRKWRDEQEKREKAEAKKKPSKVREGSADGNAHGTRDVTGRSRVDRIGSDRIGSNPIESDPLTSTSTSTPPPSPPQAGGMSGGSASPSSDNGAAVLDGEVRTPPASGAATEGPSAAPVDPRDPLPPSLQELLDVSEPDRFAGLADPENGNGRAAWYAAVEGCCARAGHGGELASHPMASAMLGQMDMLREGGATADEVAAAFLKRNPASMPSTVFRDVRRRLERGRR